VDAQSIKAIRPASGRTLIVTWKNGTETPVDVGAHLDAYAVFAPLRDDPAAFSQVRVGEWGWNAHWTDDMEIATDTLWRLALEQGAAWLKAWRLGRSPKLSQAEAAAASSRAAMVVRRRMRLSGRGTGHPRRNPAQAGPA